MNQKIIYDFGMNNGDDLPYYLLKADKVVGVEANATLCKMVRTKYKKDIDSGRLVIVNCVLTSESTDRKIPFYIHKQNHVLSQMDIKNENPDDYTKTEVDGRTASSIIFEYGNPYYIKIDIEFADLLILQEIQKKKITPPYISVEMHNKAVFDVLLEMGYTTFNMVEGSSVADLYRRTKVEDRFGHTVQHTFPFHSAGPFGRDIHRSTWVGKDAMKAYLSCQKEGWRDLHATKEIMPNGEVFSEKWPAFVFIERYLRKYKVYRICKRSLFAKKA